VAKLADSAAALGFANRQVQEYFETYIPRFCHPPRKVKFFFDVYDAKKAATNFLRI
jgi:hypothetical protein